MIAAKTSRTGSIIITAELVSVSLVAGEYLDKVTENAAMKVYVLARVDETQQMITLKDDFRLRMPDLQLEVQCITNIHTPPSLCLCLIYSYCPASQD